MIFLHLSGNIRMPSRKIWGGFEAINSSTKFRISFTVLKWLSASACCIDRNRWKSDSLANTPGAAKLPSPSLIWRFQLSRAEKNRIGNQSRPESWQESRSARKDSRIGSDPILFLTIFSRRWPRVSSRLLVTNVTILPYCMVITSPRTGSLRDNTTVASWKLGTSFEIFLSKKSSSNEIRPKIFIVHILKCIKN